MSTSAGIPNPALSRRIMLRLKGRFRLIISCCQFGSKVFLGMPRILDDFFPGLGGVDHSMDDIRRRPI